MDYMVTAVINGEERPLNYSVEVLFKVNEKYGGINHLLDILEADKMESLDALRWLTVELANDGELCRRAAGMTPAEMISIESISPRMKPFDYAVLKGQVISAVNAGYRKENESAEEVDLGLAELLEKKAPAGE